jgi:hypothetical protein
VGAPLLLAFPSMTPEGAPSPHRAWNETALRIGLAAAGLLLALAAFGRYRNLEGARRELTEWLAASGQPVEVSLERELAREPDVDGLTVRAVRASLAREIHTMAHADAAIVEGLDFRQQRAARLAETARRAGAVMTSRPASWEAALVLGAATYLSGSQVRDSRVFTEHEHWEEPLFAAQRLAPAKRDPLRFLTTVYLEIWPSLSPPKRETTRHLVAEMLRDPDDLAMILEPWLDTSGDRRTALSAVPADPRAWERVEKALARRGDWQGFSEARHHWDRTLLIQLQTDLATADSNLAYGDSQAARALYLSVLERAQSDLAYRDLMAAALTRCPPGPVGRDTAAILARHLEWAVQRCLVAECALAPPVLKRLARLAGGAAPPEEATALLLSGDLPGALTLERQAETGWSDAWAPYLVLKARALVGRRQLAEAAAALDFIPNSWWERPTYWQARLELARASEDAAAAQRANLRLREMTRRSWPAALWTWRRERARLEMLVGEPARAIEIDLAEIPPGGTVAELRLDGALLDTLPARPTFTFELPLRPGLHFLEVESVLGGKLVPGDVRLR